MINRFDTPVQQAQPVGFYQLPYKDMAQVLQLRQGAYDTNLQGLLQGKVQLADSPVATFLEPDVQKKAEIEQQFEQKYQEWMDKDLSKLGKEIQQTVMDTFYNPDLRAIQSRAAQAQAYQKRVGEMKESGNYAPWVEGPFQSQVSQYNQQGEFNRDFSLPEALPYYDVQEEFREIGKNVPQQVIEGLNNNAEFVWIEGKKYKPQQYIAEAIKSGMSDRAQAALQGQYQYDQMLNPGRVYETKSYNSTKTNIKDISKGSSYGDFVNQLAYGAAEQFADFDYTMSNLRDNPYFKSAGSWSGDIFLGEAGADTEATPTVDLDQLTTNKQILEEQLRFLDSPVARKQFTTDEIEEQKKKLNARLAPINKAFKYGLENTKVDPQNFVNELMTNLFQIQGVFSVSPENLKKSNVVISHESGDVEIPYKSILQSINNKTIYSAEEFVNEIENITGLSFNGDEQLSLNIDGAPISETVYTSSPDEVPLIQNREVPSVQSSEIYGAFNQTLSRGKSTEKMRDNISQDYHKIFTNIQFSENTETARLSQEFSEEILRGNILFTTLDGLSSEDKEVKDAIGEIAAMEDVKFYITDQDVDGNPVFQLQGVDGEEKKTVRGVMTSNLNNTQIKQAFLNELYKAAQKYQTNGQLDLAETILSIHDNLVANNLYGDIDGALVSLTDQIDDVVPVWQPGNNSIIYGPNFNYRLIKTKKGFTLTPLNKGGSIQTDENDTPIKYTDDIINTIQDIKIAIVRHERTNSR